MKSRIIGIIKLIFLAFLVAFTSIGCHNNVNSPVHTGFDLSDFMTADGFVVDNDTPLTTLLTEEYALADLNAFFGDNISQGERLLEHAKNETVYSWEEVNSQFPVQCLRFHKNVHYSVFKVKNGGYYYVFWQVPVISVPYRVFPYEELKITAHSSVYIDKLPTAASFRVIEKGRSTARNVSEVDPTVELNLFGSTPRSYSLLNDGCVLVIDYSFVKLERLEDLIVENILLLSKDDVPSDLAAILPLDLPQNTDDTLS